MIDSTSSTNSTRDAGYGTDSANKASSNSKDALASKDVFMKLLVAQLKYQNPMNPADGVEFMTQLAQFTQLEQAVASRQSLENIEAVLTGTQTA